MRDMLLEKAIAAQVTARAFRERAIKHFHLDERGQGSAEYIGVVVVVVSITGVLILASDGLGEIVKTKLKEVINSIQTK